MYLNLKSVVLFLKMSSVKFLDSQFLKGFLVQGRQHFKILLSFKYPGLGEMSSKEMKNSFRKNAIFICRDGKGASLVTRPRKYYI